MKTGRKDRSGHFILSCLLSRCSSIWHELMKTGREDRLGNPVSYWDFMFHNKGTANEEMPDPDDIMKRPCTQKAMKKAYELGKKAIEQSNSSTKGINKAQGL